MRMRMHREASPIAEEEDTVWKGFDEICDEENVVAGQETA